jgi:hypothetical protein
MTRVGGNAHVGQSQRSFRGHARDFQAIKVFRFQIRDDLLDRFAGSFFSSEPKAFASTTPAM